MISRKTSALFGALLAMVSLVPLAAHAQSKQPGGSATFTVTAVPKNDADVSNIAKDNVQLFQGKERKQIADWKKGDTLF
ncbi:hypothetical protein C1X24_27260, partial [Pseudomonas sp. FW305-124]|uniref:hypothetical protein n=1 Tax=Pseudomonas sp. FW305-124 TaxID=2070649 RepID=UPI000CAC3D18